MTNSIYWGEPCGKGVFRAVIPCLHNELLLERIRMETGCRVIPQEKSEAEIRKLIHIAHSKNPDQIIQDIELKKPAVQKTNSWESEPIINLVDSLIESAIERKATDIHFEPTDTEFRVRFRIDGLLVNHKSLPKWLAEPVLIRLKLLAKVDITERRLPHDGSFHFQGLQAVNIRLSTLPIQNGEFSQEKCVLRLLPATDKGLRLSDLNLSRELLVELQMIFQKPQGLFLVTGPTGSGKTTTLYAGLREILERKINVVTIEDPVEYKLQGANQVQVNEKCGFTFATALRSILRQDPDVILVGEIRDAETARIAIQAAQTGHLVLSTLHTNSAKAALTRLKDLGIEEFLIEDCILGIVAQRLLRVNNHPCNKQRVAIMECLRPNGTYVNGTLADQAHILLKQGYATQEEIFRTLGICS